MTANVTDPRVAWIEGIILTHHAVMGYDGGEPTRVVRQVLEAVMSFLANAGGRDRIWSETFRILGTYHTGANRFDIIHACLSILSDLEANQCGRMKFLATSWIRTIAAANIHPASLALCTTYMHTTLRQELTSLVNVLEPSIEINPELKVGTGVDFWKVQVNSKSAPTNILAVGALMMIEGQGCRFLNLGKGWVVGGDLELMFCRELTSLGPDLTVYHNLGLHYCQAVARNQDSVRVGFVIRETNLRTVHKRSGYKGIRSRLGYYFEGFLVCPGPTRWGRRTQNIGKALVVPNSLGQLSLLAAF